MSPLDQTLAFLRLLAGDQPQGRYLEIRSRIPSGMRQEFFAATRLDALHRRALWLGQQTDTYIGVVLRDTRSGKKEAISRSHLIWCEIDSADAGDRLADARVSPVLAVHSGSRGHLHCYWRTKEQLDRDLLERANQALVKRLGGDPACTDAGRLLRIPGSLSFKHTPPRPVSVASYDVRAEPLPLEQLVGELPVRETPTQAPASARPFIPSSSPAHRAVDRTSALKLIPAGEWAVALVGVEANREGKITCPFHAGGKERTPSLQLYSDGTWFCYACRQGGSVLDFASRLWGLPTRDQSFNALRDRLWEILGPYDPPSASIPVPSAASEMALP